MRELTETAYLLSAEEPERGTILACQSVPIGEVTVEVDRAPRASPRAEATSIEPDRVRSSAPWAGALHDLKFFGFHAVGLCAAAGRRASGGIWWERILAPREWVVSER